MRARGETRASASILVAAAISLVLGIVTFAADVSTSNAANAAISTTETDPCSLNTFNGIVISQNSGAGTTYVQIAIHALLIGRQCTVKGVPRMQLMGANGRKVKTRQSPITSSALSGSGDQQIVVLPGSTQQWISFYLAYQTPMEVNRPSLACPTSSSLTLTVPGNPGQVAILAKIQAASLPARPSPCGKVMVGGFYAGLGSNAN